MNIAHPFVMIFFLFLTSITFALFGFIIGLWADNFEKLQLIPILIITPLVFLGGSFYSINMLPEFWQNVSLVNPILYMVNAFRYSFLGQSDISIEIAFTVTALFVIFLFLVSARLLNKGVGLRT